MDYLSILNVVRRLFWPRAQPWRTHQGSSSAAEPDERREHALPLLGCRAGSSTGKKKQQLIQQHQARADLDNSREWAAVNSQTIIVLSPRWPSTFATLAERVSRSSLAGHSRRSRRYGEGA